MDDSFSSLDLFRSLHTYGHEATGIARPNCGFHKELQKDRQGEGGISVG
ncbi:hypothetical protein FOXG_22745 [Fusarium oxysporum f. sp. lycopersici 4287]|uniref:PiggyBac transposable element-derived protein domain-containing protein n=1 Tax=Fusarium oxysporum f. sp. lycopersici (strain 4287 / CBS 123668 / FGSC 9935 / NRRL 34936) TaxID=426428 RepID=A0A0J9WVT3_FUSO4|nr:hypothetical protein FOXG_22745 [Fusarium oxysporum f. sp. lycopersici 4287]KNB20082.1 hypothetical protein FOXG_22745 [Fusarium oxysporum f. sp. lycopersici 4287]